MAKKRGMVLVMVLAVSFFLGFSDYTYAEEKGLVGHWKFDEGKGDIAKDSSGKGNHGKIHGGAKWVKNGLEFDGIDDYVDCGNDESLNITGEITVEAWVKPNAVPKKGEGLACKADHSYGFTHSVAGNVCSYIKSGRMGLHTTLVNGIWTHIVQTYDGTRRRLYKNGEEVMSRPLRKDFSSDAKFMIGKITGYFNGTIDEVKIYNRALTLKEIKEEIKQSGKIKGSGSLKVSGLVYVPRNVFGVILPNQFPVEAPLSNEINVTVCPGEYEPASFVIYALRDIENLSVKVSRLIDGDKRLPREVVDVRVVKCWYQAGSNNLFEKDERILVPELLLHDAGLVHVDTEKKENFIRDITDAGKTVYVPISTPTSDKLTNIRPKDAKQLLPVSIPVTTSKQFWLTIHLPADARPGNYKGTIKLRAKGAKLPVLNLSVRVLPFNLVKTRGIIGIWYRGKLSQDSKVSIDSEWKSPQQYMAELENMKAHGVLYPTFFQGYNEELLRQEIQLREKAGLPKGIFVSCRNEDLIRQEKEIQLRSRWSDRVSAEAARRWTKFLAPLGYTDVHFFEEPGVSYMNESLQQKTARYKACREAGGKVFCWFATDHIDDAMREQIDLGVTGGMLDEVDKFHKLGHKLLSFRQMPVREREAHALRHGYSLSWWKDGYDGVHPIEYQHAHGHIWNDFDNRLRDHNYTYPTIDGVIDTLQWEAFREGIDDVRYVTTLEQAIKKAESSGNSEIKEAVLEAKSYLKGLKAKDTQMLHKNLDIVRREIINHILKLQEE